MGTEVRYCTDYADELGWTFAPGHYFKECCWSCHEDADEGYDGLSEIEVPGTINLEGLVCCHVMVALEEKRGIT